MGIFDFFKAKGKHPELMASGSYDVSIPEERFVCADARIDGKPFAIDNPNTISAIVGMCGMALDDTGYVSFLDHGKFSADIADKSDSVRIWLFTKMMRCFFDLYPQFASQRKTGNDTTKSTLRLIVIMLRAGVGNDLILCPLHY